jgi:hypothetical protein
MMQIFLDAYPFIILSYGLFTAALMTIVGCLLGFDMLRKDSRYDVSKFIPALFWFGLCALLSATSLGVTKWALTL